MNRSDSGKVDFNQVQGILSIGQVLVSTLNFDEVMYETMQQMRELFNAEASSLLLVDDETGDLEFFVALGDAGSVVRQFRLKRGEGLAGAVAESRNPLIINDVDKDARHHKLVDKISQFQTRSMMVAPLVYGDKVVAVVEVINSHSGRFEEWQMEQVMMLAPFAAIAIENARFSSNLETMVSERTAELEQANKRLREIDTAKSEFLSNTAHELKTPLSAMRTTLKLMMQGALGALTDDQSEILTDCVSGIDRLFRMISTLMSLAKIEAGIMELHHDDLEVAAHVFDAVKLLKAKAAEKNQTISLDISEGRIVTDADKLTQIIINLVGNAVKYTPENGSIDVEVNMVDNIWTFKVTDTGPGMTGEQIGQLFVRFKRLKEIAGDKIAGTGLGLAITRKLVEFLGGKIYVESEPGVGSSFIFTLPEDVGTIHGNEEK